MDDGVVGATPMARGPRLVEDHLHLLPAILVDRNAELVILAGAIDDAESIFSYSDQGRLVGKTFPAGDKLLSIDYAVHPELGGFTELRLDFEIRHDRGTMTWQRHGDIIRQVPDYDRHLFAEVGTALTLTAVPYPDRGFQSWRIFDPNYPGDANYAAVDTNMVLHLTMDIDWEVKAVFQCSSGTEMLLPILMISGIAMLLRRR